MPRPNLLFIDTNIWLDFYRARNETTLKLLTHAEALSGQLIVTYQLESEFKKNRQVAIIEGMQELKAPQQIPRIGIFSDAKALAIIERSRKQTESRIKALKARIGRVLKNPALHDPVYKTCQRLFHKGDDLTLTRDNPVRRRIRNMAFKRFLHGCPPRKRNDTSIGDAINWEWMVDCATRRKAGLVIVSRDSDYGATIDGVSYINDHLRQEFSERISRKRTLLLYSRLSDALKLFKIEVSAQEEQSENELLTDVEDRKNPNSAPLSALSAILSGESSSSARTSGIERLATLRKLLNEGMEESS
ncbi:MAG TPA: PIN domain-containing protein [Candidatus Sulfotelmatobacter sp.]|nr:PIN domain-containing protein [Candidatus Sulfotelmatobacter sp.]